MWGVCHGGCPDPVRYRFILWRTEPGEGLQLCTGPTVKGGLGGCSWPVRSASLFSGSGAEAQGRLVARGWPEYWVSPVFIPD